LPNEAKNYKKQNHNQAKDQKENFFFLWEVVSFFDTYGYNFADFWNWLPLPQ
jgi:hypothetical protein